MGLFDKLKGNAGKLNVSKLKDVADDLAEKHGDTIKQGIDKAAGVVDSRTKGKYGDKLDKGVAKAKGVVDDLARPDDPGDAPAR